MRTKLGETTLVAVRASQGQFETRTHARTVSPLLSAMCCIEILGTRRDLTVWSWDEPKSLVTI